MSKERKRERKGGKKYWCAKLSVKIYPRVAEGENSPLIFFFFPMPLRHNLYKKRQIMDRIKKQRMYRIKKKN